MGSLRKAAKKSYGSRQRWDEDFKDEQFKIPSKPTRVRLGPEISGVPMHYVKFRNKEGKETGFYELCVNWNYDREEREDRGCPMCESGIRETTYSYGYLIARTEQAKGNLQVRPVRLTPKHTNDIVKLSDVVYEDGEAPDGWDDDELPDATDPAFGFDLMISVDESNNKTEYKVTVPIKKPQVKLTKEEFRAFKAYAQQVDFNALAKKAQPSVSDVQKKLQSIGLIEGDDSSSRSLGKKKKPKARAEEDYDAYDDEVPEDDPVDPAPKKKKRPAKKAKQVAAIGEDDDESSEGLPWDEDDDDGSVEKTYATADEDDAPDDDDYEDDDYED